MPSILIGHTPHRVGRRICSGNPQDPCNDNNFIDPMTGLSARLSNSANLPQTTGTAFSIGTRNLNERTNGPVLRRKLIPGFNNR